MPFRKTPKPVRAAKPRNRPPRSYDEIEVDDYTIGGGVKLASPS